MEENYKFKTNMPLLQDHVQPRVAAVHDICGYGKCSLAVALSTISVAGVDVLPVPTSVLSCHTQFPSYSFFDTTPTLNDFIDNWRENSVEVDGVYTGFLGSVEQIALIQKLIAQYPDSFNIIDPVMGDNGHAYPTYTESMCKAMTALVPLANVLTPNITEASILLGEDFPGVNISYNKAREIAQKLIDLGAQAVVLKGIESEQKITNLVMNSAGEWTTISHDLHPVKLHGTGDLFAACITAGLFSGHDLISSTEFASQFVYAAIDFSTTQKGYQIRGVNYEPLLYKLVDFCRSDKAKKRNK